MRGSRSITSILIIAFLLLGLVPCQLGNVLFLEISPGIFAKGKDFPSLGQLVTSGWNLTPEEKITDGIRDKKPIVVRMINGSFILAYGHAQPQTATYIKVSPDGLKWNNPVLVIFSGEGDSPKSLIQTLNESLILLYRRANLNQMYESNALYVTFSNTGSTWSSSILVDQSYQKIATASLVQISNETLMVIYTTYDGGSFVVFSNDLGETWLNSKKIVVEPDGWRYSYRSSLAKTLDGRLVFAFTTENETSGAVRLMVAFSADSGVVWQNHTVISGNVTSWMPEIIQGGNGVFIAAFPTWSVRNKLYFVRSYDGLHWTAPRRFSGDLYDYRYPSLEYMGNGDFLSVYWGTKLLSDEDTDTSIYSQLLPMSVMSAPIILDIHNRTINNFVNKIFSWTAWDNNPSMYYIYRNGTLMHTDTWESGKEIMYNLSEILPGSYLFEVMVEDLDGNMASSTAMITVLQSTSSNTTSSDGTSGTTVGPVIEIPLILFFLSLLVIIRYKHRIHTVIS